MTDLNKICPQCGAEYVFRASICADCEVPLQWEKPQPKRRLPKVKIVEAGWDNIPPGKILGQVTSDDDDIIESYLGFLKEAGIQGSVLPFTAYESAELKYSFSVVFGTTVSGGTAGQVPVGSVIHGFNYMLFVAQEDYEQAEAVVKREFALLHPEQEHGFGREYEMDACPACGCGLDGEVGECPDCGLSFG